MKKVVPVFLLLFWGLFANGQQRENGNYVFWPYNQYTDKIEFSESVSLPGTSADSLFTYASFFADTAFTGDRDSVNKDWTHKTVLCQGNYYIPTAEVGERGKGYVSYTLSIQCRSNYYRYVITNLVHYPMYEDGVIGGPLENDRTTSGGMLFPRQYWERTKTRCYYMILNTINQLKQAMNQVES